MTRRFEPSEKRTPAYHWRRRVERTHLTMGILSWAYLLRAVTWPMLSAILQRRSRRDGKLFVASRYGIRRDSHLERRLRRLFDTGWLWKLRRELCQKDIYVLSGKARKGKATVRSLYGRDLRLERRLSTRNNSKLDHLLEVAWARAYLTLACRAQGYRLVKAMDDLALEVLHLGRIPDLALIFDKGQGRGKRGFLIECEKLSTTPSLMAGRLLDLVELLRDTATWESILGTGEVRLMVVLSTLQSLDPVAKALSIKRELEEEGVEPGLVLLTTQKRLFQARPEELFTSPIFWQTGKEGPCPIYRSISMREVRPDHNADRSMEEKQNPVRSVQLFP